MVKIKVSISVCNKNADKVIIKTDPLSMTRWQDSYANSVHQQAPRLSKNSFALAVGDFEANWPLHGETSGSLCSKSSKLQMYDQAGWLELCPDFSPSQERQF